MGALDTLWRNPEPRLWHAALTAYWTMDDVRQQWTLEQQIQHRHQNHQSILTDTRRFYEFLHDEVYPWKLDVPNRASNQRALAASYAKNPAQSDRIRYGLLVPSLATEDVAKVLNGLTPIAGMGIAVASGCLAVLFPEWFGAVDKRTLQGFLTLTDEPIVDFLQSAVDDPKTFFDQYQRDDRLHAAKLMIQRYRTKAIELNQHAASPFWTPRKVEMVVWTLRDS